MLPSVRPIPNCAAQGASSPAARRASAARSPPRLPGSGVQVAIADIDLAGRRAPRQEIGGGAVAVEVDVRKRASVEAAFAQALARLGGFDILDRQRRRLDHAARARADRRGMGLQFRRQCARRFSSPTRSRRGIRRAGHGRASSTPLRSPPRSARRCSPIIRRANSRCSAGRRRWRANSRRPASASTRSAPASCKTGMQEREIEWEARLRGVTPERVVADYIAQTPLGRLETAGGRR